MSELRVGLPEPISDDPVGSSVLAHQPAALHAFNRLYGTLWRRGIVDPATKELARIRNARTVNCTVCKAIRFSTAREAGLDEAQLDLVGEGFETSALSAKQKAVIRYVDVMIGDPGSLSEALRAELLAHFSAAELVELSAGIALFMGFSKIAVSLGGLPESLPVFEQPTPEVP